ncbi:oxygen-independent coproporphyrinogen-III oxidase-like protein HemZ [Oxobacter pfennigii]|uniref:Oxygen-independent coproporphyrinogen-III oxidase-like protein HemZ n=1 Tax=Oxobacter pfennigii TaxID=36849 RepID=A0A0P9AFS2_9CLOT|nr:B12-binding domain-containing radical SAM protein [Oxobacter pfennigii]KPU44211.1 oxygen-independent coproporphyrinogen-III oxidase-like protein HemZ [Oxobacter pfennigii]
MKIILTEINSKFVHTNLALRYIKACLKGLDVTLAEYSVNDALDNIIGELNKMKPDILGFSCYIWNIEYVLKIIGSMKKINPKLLVVLGGPEVSYDCTKLMEENTSIDFIVKGEGERTAQELFLCLEGRGKGLKDIYGIVFRKDNGIIENINAPLIENLDSIPFPYDDSYDFKNKILYYEASRGCPYNCSYCLSSTIPGVRFFSVERIKRDLLWFIDKQVKLVKFVDRTFNCAKHTLEVFKFLAEHSMNTKFHFEISADILDDETIEFLQGVRSGLFQFEIGVQSVNNTTLSLIDRKTKIDILFKNIARLREKGNINIHLDLIAGLPGEDFNSFRDSFDSVFSLKPHMLQLGFLKLLKGSKITRESEIYGIQFNDYPPYEVLKTDLLSFDELIKLKETEKTLDRYYNSGRFQCSMNLLLMQTQSPFVLFEEISAFQYETFKKTIKLSNEGQYKLIYDYGEHLNTIDINILKESLAFDYLRQGRNPSVPDFLMQEIKIDKKFIWNLASNREFIKKKMPHYEDKSTKEILKNIYIRKFSFDAYCLLSKGELCIKDTYIVFDYRIPNTTERANFFYIE